MPPVAHKVCDGPCFVTQLAFHWGLSCRGYDLSVRCGSSAGRLCHTACEFELTASIQAHYLPRCQQTSRNSHVSGLALPAGGGKQNQASGRDSPGPTAHIDFKVSKPDKSSPWNSWLAGPRFGPGRPGTAEPTSGERQLWVSTCTVHNPGPLWRLAAHIQAERQLASRVVASANTKEGRKLLQTGAVRAGQQIAMGPHWCMRCYYR